MCGDGTYASAALDFLADNPLGGTTGLYLVAALVFGPLVGLVHEPQELVSREVPRLQ